MPNITTELTLLYIEDDSELIENVGFLLGKFVKEVYTAQDGEEALEMYAKHQPDIIVTDISIPKISGLEVATQIRAENKTIPIVLITAHNEEHQVQQAKEIGVSTYVRKPFTLSELKEAVRKAISEHS